MSYRIYTYIAEPRPVGIQWNIDDALDKYKECRDRVHAMKEWCDENLGHWGCDQSGNNHEFWFVNEEEYLMFLLRWSES